MIERRTAKRGPDGYLVVLLIILETIIIIANVSGETLTPPYFNLAEGKNISATATCGVDTEGPELYCKLIGANSDKDLDVNVILGQYCDYCDPTKPEKSHPPEHAVDGMETWWQSPPLSRGMKYNEVNLTIDLGQEFHVAYIYIKMANSPRPGLWVLEKSADYGKTYTPWQYFSDSPVDCEKFFGKETLQPITRDDSVICTTEYSKIVPLEGGEIPISLLQKRPSAKHYFNSTVLQEWTRATNVRLRFLRTKNLLGHLMSVARQDPTVTRRYFYSIKDISIGGRCMCNGHAQTCDIPDPRDNKVLLCRCSHNTCGAKCDSCCPGFEQKAWRQSKHDRPFSCEPCNCFQHSNECVYDPVVDKERRSLDMHGRYDGGGVCQNCQHNTEGVNCNRCRPRFYRPYTKAWNETDVCQPCRCDNFYSTGNCAEGSGRCECRKEFTPPNCDKCSFGYYDYPNCKPCECFLNATLNLQCSSKDGQCTCLPNYGGKYCKECAPGYYKFPECIYCECDLNGADSPSCEQESGNCSCKVNYAGRKCEECKDGYHGFPACTYCNCDLSGTKEGICDKSSGQCICKEGYGGERCDQCVLGYYGYPNCQPCNCSKVGSHGSTCSAAGKCSCLVNYAGRTCEQCSPGYYNYPDCKPCDCHPHGANGVSCDNEGKCECYRNFAGQQCDMCREGYYNFPACEDCNCNPAGVIAGFAGCGSVPAGELCQCKERVEGRICDKCKPLYWNLNSNNPEGCERCNCNKSGVLGGIQVCDNENGQCVCKPSVIARGCSECADGTYHLSEDNLFGCTDCGCDVGGSVNSICDKRTGQCICQSRVTGRTCKEPLQAHYFPTLYQYQYEVEDGRTPENSRVRYANDESVFPNYSWKGYAVFSVLQKEVVKDIFIYKPSLYRMVFRFVNNNPYTVIGGIKITPDNPNDIEQYLKVQFRNTSEPSFITVSGETGNTPSPFVMNPGRWSISISVNESVFLDYFVLLPEDFYLATILNQNVEKPCTIDEKGLCRHYAYPNITFYDKTFGVGGYITQNGGSNRIEPVKEYYPNVEHLSKAGVLNRVPVLNANQSDINFNISVYKPGPYVVVINYLTPIDDLRTHKVNIVANTKNGTEYGSVTLYSCPYTTVCRQVVTNRQDGVAIYEVGSNSLTINLKGDNPNVGIHSVYAIPLDEWSLDFIKPKPVCIRKNESCVESTFRNPPETKKIQLERETEGELSKNRPPINDTKYVWLNPADNSIDVKGKVPTPGYYTFVLHYYQPDYPDYDLDVIIQNGQFYEAKVPVQYCPTLSGCRSVVVQNDRNNQFSLTENFMITIKQPGNKNVYLDYLLVIPADLYNDRNLEQEQLDRTLEFIATCGSNHFNIDTTQEGFCRDSVFSITANHNSGALPCQCDFYGSQSFECEKFGGQCQCKENIIGRQCTACKPGYYGFPECKECNCPPTAYCEPSSGQCICPPHVIGENCDQCEALTYGYDSIIGCEECRCNYLGVNGTRQCDLLSGACPCKENIVGRPCDVCKAGHYSFPYCESCDCDTKGTVPEICDQNTAECFCKKNVVGPQCNFCREGSFNLQENNEEGCTDCFCFGKTTRCISAQLINTPLIEMSDWQVVSVNVSGNRLNSTELNLTIENVGSDNTIGVDFTEFNLNETTAYFKAPRDYLGKKLASYGGYLNYSIYYVIGRSGSAISGADVILEGADTYLTYASFEQPPPATDYAASLQLVESNFEMPSGVPAKREHIMEVLKDLRGVYLRASYWTASVTTRLTNVIQDEGTFLNESPNSFSNDIFIPLINSVEQCQCPPNYQGLSCEECAPGYYRISSGPHGGFCVPCQCNGHATECDVNTGICFNCTHSTRGDHCELCEVGYHGNALAGTPMDCLICACPLPITSNNFATGCEVSADGEKISCDCREGYFGARCQSCAAGYYGRPETPNDYCKPCQCSGNINPKDPASCDTGTGRCLKCLNNTFGEACALCAPGYFGDAVQLKDCQACICDELGTDHCDSFTGRCVCKPNVVGEKCDRCEIEHFGFQSGRGCVPCECAEASDSSQCDDVKGQCKCRPGVTGRSCDRCQAGYWNLTSEGCVSCGCKSEYSLGFGCNALTGQCECLQGVIGEKCDQCPHRWAFVPEFGCHQCDSCVHPLLDDTDALAAMIDPIIIEFDSTQSGYFTRRRLENMREQLDKLTPKFDEVDPKLVSLEDPIKELESIEQDSKNLNRKSNYSLENSESLRNQSIRLKDRAEVLLNELEQAEEDSIRAIEEIDKITGELNEEAGNEVDKALQEGEALLEAMKLYNLTGREVDATKQLKKVNELWKSVSDYEAPVDNLKKEVEEIKKDIKTFNEKLEDLYNHTQYSLNVGKDAERIIARSGHRKKPSETIEEPVEVAEKNAIPTYKPTPKSQLESLQTNKSHIPISYVPDLTFRHERQIRPIPRYEKPTYNPTPLSLLLNEGSTTGQSDEKKISIINKEYDPLKSEINFEDLTTEFDLIDEIINEDEVQAKFSDDNESDSEANKKASSVKNSADLSISKTKKSSDSNINKTEKSSISDKESRAKITEKVSSSDKESRAKSTKKHSSSDKESRAKTTEKHSDSDKESRVKTTEKHSCSDKESQVKTTEKHSDSEKESSSGLSKKQSNKTEPKKESKDKKKDKVIPSSSSDSELKKDNKNKSVPTKSSKKHSEKSIESSSDSDVKKDKKSSHRPNEKCLEKTEKRDKSSSSGKRADEKKDKNSDSEQSEKERSSDKNRKHSSSKEKGSEKSSTKEKSGKNKEKDKKGESSEKHSSSTSKRKRDKSEEKSDDKEKHNHTKNKKKDKHDKEEDKSTKKKHKNKERDEEKEKSKDKDKQSIEKERKKSSKDRDKKNDTSKKHEKSDEKDKRDRDKKHKKTSSKKPEKKRKSSTTSISSHSSSLGNFENNFDDIRNVEIDNLNNFEPEISDIDLDDEDETMRECLKIFNEYKPKPVASVPESRTMQQGSEFEDNFSDIMNSKKRTAHDGAEISHLYSKVQPPPKVKTILTPGEALRNRLKVARQAQKAREDDNVMSEIEKIVHTPQQNAKRSAPTSLLEAARQLKIKRTERAVERQPIARAASIVDDILNGTASSTAGFVPRKKISAAPNVALIQKAKERISRIVSRPPEPIKTVAHNQKTSRVAHVPEYSLSDIPDVLQAAKSKLPVNVRTRFLTMIADECVKLYLSRDDAYGRALNEEFACYEKCKVLATYRNSAMLAVNRLRKEIQERVSKGLGLMFAGENTDADKSNDFEGRNFYNNVARWVLTEEELKLHGYPREAGDRGRVVINDKKEKDYSLDANYRRCSRKDRLKSKLANIESQIEQSKGHLDESEALLSNASDLLSTSIGKLKRLQSSPEELDSRNNEFESRLDTNKEEIEQIRELKPKVQEHANDLSDKVQKLEHILSESQFGSNDAIKAARAYKDIVEAVKSARAAAEAAQNDTDHAVDILTNVQDRTFDSDANSSRALDDAFKLRQTADDSLGPRLKTAMANYQPVQDKHNRNDEVLKEIEKILNNIRFLPLDKAYRNASNMADTARDQTSAVDNLVNTSFANLPEETQKAKALPKDLDDMSRNLVQTEKQIATVNEKLPAVIESLEQLPEVQKQHKELSDKIKNSLNKLNQQIELARDVANRIKIGEKFYPNTTLELRNPSNIEDLTTSTKISGYFKTAKPNGLIFYLGNPNGTNLRKTKTDDYMALVVQNGYPVLKLDIGNGPEQLINDKYVSDNTWYQFIIERIGHNAKLTIREELQGGKENLITAEKSLSGPYTIFNLDKEKSKVFVGGFPPQYEMQKEIDVTSFEGEVEELVIGNSPVSLWNFNNGYENNHGAVERDKLVVLQPSTGFRFNGQGYVIVDARSLQLRSKSTIQLSFKTFATEGLIFLAGRDNTFVALELRNGKLLYQYNLGGGTKLFASSNRYNDGLWHKVTAIRDGARGKLTIDDENVIDRTQPVTGASLEVIETISFGGYPHVHNFKEVTGVKFDGCINNVTITGEPIDLRNNLKAYDVTPGCPARFAPMVSFNKSRPGYVGWDRLSIDNNFKISLKFKTNVKDGLIFYATDMDQTNGISLALTDGYLKVISQKTELMSTDTFNDSEWHVVSVIHNDKMLRVDFDDYGYKVTDGAPPSIHTLYATLYVGGLPRKVRPLPGTVGSEEPFHGCITDLTVNGNVKNFANTTDRSNEVLDKCVLDGGYEPTDPSVHVLPELPPSPELVQPTTAQPILPETESPWATIKPGRGDGGADRAPNETVTEPPLEIPVTEIVAKLATVQPDVREPGRGVLLTTSKPVVKDGCVLPLVPEPEDLKSHGYRFGAQKVSRLEYNTPRGKLRKTFDFSLDFKTEEGEGILFYVSDGRTHKHYVALHLSDGYLVYTFRGDHEPLVIRSQLTYNDNQWHFVQFSRDGSNGKLVIDNKDIQGRLPQKTTVLDLHIPFYIGGLFPDDYNYVQANLNTTVQFKGCLRNFNMNSKPMESPKEFGVIPCSDNVEVGTFFGGGLNTYIKLRDRFKVGTVFNIKMSIKPRVDSGLLIAVHGRKDYLILEMVDGVLKLTAENGEGPMTASFLPPQKNKFYLCDGQWHEIQAVKSKNVVTLSVDNFFTDPKVGDYHATSTDTGSALFLGGHRLLKRVRGITARTPFVGCIKDVAINNEPIDLHTTMVEGNITVGTCRTN